MNLHFLPGFLGRPSDWDIFKTKFRPHYGYYYAIEDFLPPDEEQNIFSNWPKMFHKAVFNHQNLPQNKNILVGYSLGGRLALHCLAEENLWDGAIIISAHPGIANDAEKKARVQNDLYWGQRFLNEPWQDVIQAWNAQGVFLSQKNHLIREEKFYQREKIYKVITEFSLGKQDDLRDKIKDFTKPVLWLAGELDGKFTALADEMASLNKNIKSTLIPRVGHRVPWESPEKFENVCRSFLQWVDD